MVAGLPVASTVIGRTRDARSNVIGGRGSVLAGGVLSGRRFSPCVAAWRRLPWMTVPGTPHWYALKPCDLGAAKILPFRAITHDPVRITVIESL
jgi:hypothetical protein